MAESDVNKIYRRLVEDGERHGALEPKGSGSERRKQPRFRANATELTVRAELKVAAIDVSVSGLAFHSQFPVQIGQALNITVANLFTVDSEVVFCHLEEANEDFTQTLYRVQCRFPEEEQGKYLLVMIKELEKKRQD
jgi:hypothetical protein